MACTAGVSVVGPQHDNRRVLPQRQFAGNARPPTDLLGAVHPVKARRFAGYPLRYGDFRNGESAGCPPVLSGQSDWRLGRRLSIVLHWFQKKVSEDCATGYRTGQAAPESALE